MKTITEFNAIAITKVSTTQKDLVTSGKTPEELPAAMLEATGMTEEKLKHAQAAAEVVGERTKDFKRVVVYAVAEGETAPTGALVREGHAYVAEYYPPMAPKGAAGKPADDRGGKRGDKRGGGRGDKKGGDRGGRPPGGGGGGRDRAPRPDMAAGTASAAPARAPGEKPKVIVKKPSASPATT